MSSVNEAAAETVEVRLMPYEGACLQDMLEVLLTESGTLCSRRQLALIVARLDESNAVASWLGEYVRLDLERDGVIELLEAIVATLNSDRVQTQRVLVTLSNIAEKLATFAFTPDGRQ